MLYQFPKKAVFLAAATPVNLGFYFNFKREEFVHSGLCAM